MVYSKGLPHRFLPPPSRRMGVMSVKVVEIVVRLKLLGFRRLRWSSVQAWAWFRLP